MPSGMGQDEVLVDDDVGGVAALGQGAVPVDGAVAEGGARETVSLLALAAAGAFAAGADHAGDPDVIAHGVPGKLSVDWPEAPQCPLVGLLDELRQLRWHGEFASEIRDRCKLLTAPVQPEGREVVPVEQRAEVVPDEGSGCRARCQRLAEHVEVDPGAAGEQQGLAGSYGLTEPQQVNQQLDRVPGAVTADVDDALRIGERLQHRTALVQDRRTPPTNTCSVAVRAAGTPPPTGASRTSTPRARAAAASSRPAAGLLLLMSIHTAVEGIAASTRDPAITSRTSREPGSIVMRISASAATSASVPRHCPRIA